MFVPGFDDSDDEEYESFAEWLAARDRALAARVWDDGWCAGRGRGPDRRGARRRGENPYVKRGASDA